MQKILLIEDQPEFQTLVRGILDRRFQLLIAATAAEALKIVKGEPVDLILLDVNLPDESGFSVFSKLKAVESVRDVPIIFLTGAAEVAQRVTGFSLGADDYVVKPFEPLEFRARIEAKLLTIRARQSAPDTLRKGRLVIDRSMLKAFTVDGNGRMHDLALTPHEFRLLSHFAVNEGRVFSRDQLMSQVWGDGVHVLERTVDRHISSLRRKLDPVHEKLESVHEKLESVHGVGYRFTLVTASAADQRSA